MLKDYHTPYRNLYDTLAASAAKYPDKPAIIDDDEEVSYRELLKRADEIAMVLRVKYRLREQDQIAVLMVNTANAAAVFYAAMKLGCVALMINTKLREAEICSYLEELDPKVIFSDAQWLDKAAPAADKLGLPPVITEKTNFDREDLHVQISSTQNIEDTAVIMHTSGTTGKPKGIMVTQRNILEAAYGYQEVQKTDASDITVLSVPIFHILGLSCVMTHYIYAGATVVFSRFYHVETVLEKIKKYRATHFHSVPTIYLQLIASDWPGKDLSSLRKCVCGGASISKENIDAFCALAPNAFLHLAYGMTETAGSGTLSAVHKGPLRPVPNVEMMVVDAEHNPLGPGEMGELVFIGPCVARGRWQLPSLPDDHLYSGDVGYMDEQGNVYVVDRLKDIINRGGEKIFPIQIEKVIMEYPGVSKAAVYAVSSEIYGEVPAAAIIPEQGAHINPVEVKEYLRTRIATYEMPDLIEIVSEFPVTQNGKVRKAELRRRTEEGGW